VPKFRSGKTHDQSAGPCGEPNHVVNLCTSHGTYKHRRRLVSLPADPHGWPLPYGEAGVICVALAKATGGPLAILAQAYAAILPPRDTLCHPHDPQLGLCLQQAGVSLAVRRAHCALRVVDGSMLVSRHGSHNHHSVTNKANLFSSKCLTAEQGKRLTSTLLKKVTWSRVGNKTHSTYLTKANILRRHKSGRRNTVDKLTELERCCLSLYANGLVDHEIAQSIGRAAVTVRLCFGNILAKLDARTRVHAVALALRAGVIDLDELPMAADADARICAEYPTRSHPATRWN